MHSFIHFLPSTDKEAYTDAVSPLLKSNSSTISTYSYACWGSQIGNVVADSVLLPLFKFQSMSSGILFCNGGPLGWLGERQTRTSLSLCEAKIHATCATSKKVVDFYNLCPSMGESGHTLHNMDTSTPIYNDNEACIRWSHSMITNGTRENSVHEWVQDNMVSVKHMSGKVNPTDIFTKKMKDGAYFFRLWDSFMSRLSDFNNSALLAVHVHHARQQSSSGLLPAAARAIIESGASSYFSALIWSSFCHT